MSDASPLDAEHHRNRRIALTYLERLASWELDAAFTLLSEDVRWWVPPAPEPMTKAEYRAVWLLARENYRAPPRHTVTATTAEGDRVAVEAVADADLANGGTYHNWFHWLFVVRDGLIVSGKQYMDTLVATTAFAHMGNLRESR